MYEHCVEAVVDSLLDVLRKIKPDASHEHVVWGRGAVALAARLLVRPGADLAAVQRKIEAAVRGINTDWQGTGVARDRVVKDILA